MHRKHSLARRLDRERERQDAEMRSAGTWLLRSPAWATAIALHFVAAVVLMNVVHFTMRPAASTVFRLSFRPAPPGGAAQGKQDNGVNGKDNEDSPPAGRIAAEPVLPPHAAIAPALAIPGSVRTGSLPGVDGLGGIYAGRGGAGRGDALRRNGGDGVSEKAVADGLDWLARHQEQNGSWVPGAWQQHCPANDRCPADDGCSVYTSPATGLALLAFLGAGTVPGDGSPFAGNVRRGLDWLLKTQDRFGCLDTSNSHNLYAHGICAFALVEAFALTQDPDLREPAQRAVAFSCDAQQAGGGWDYMPNATGRGDTSITSWHVMVLRSARAAGLAVPRRAWQGATGYIEDATDRRTGNIAYAVFRSAGPPAVGRGCNTMTAAGLVTRIYLGIQDQTELTSKFLADFDRVPPRFDREAGTCPNWGSGGTADECTHWSLYYTYYATLATFHTGGDAWVKWNRRMRECTLGTQQTSGHAGGSWSPLPWDCGGPGRIYATAFNVMNLEVYYRYLPCYRDGAEFGLAPLMDDRDWAPVAARVPSYRAEWQRATTEAVEKSLERNLDLLRSPSMVARGNAARDLSMTRDPKAVGPLIAAARAEKTSLRKVIVDYLGAFEASDTILEFFIEEIENAKPEVRKAALAGLRKMTGQWFGEEPGRWRTWMKER